MTPREPGESVERLRATADAAGSDSWSIAYTSVAEEGYEAAYLVNEARTGVVKQLVPIEFGRFFETFNPAFVSLLLDVAEAAELLEGALDRRAWIDVDALRNRLRSALAALHEATP